MPKPVLASGPVLLDLIADVKDDVDNFLTPQLSLAEELDVVDATRAFVTLRDIKDQLEAVQKTVSKLYEDWKTVKIPEAYDRAGVPHINLDEGIRVGVSHKLFASVRKDKKDEAYAWLREHQLGDLINETVNTSTLSAVAKGMADENLELEPEYFNVAVVANTSVVRTR